MANTVQQLAEWVSGKMVGDPDLVIRSAKTLQEAEPGDLTFIEQEKYLPQLAASKASAAIVGLDIHIEGKTLIKVKDPLVAFINIVQKLMIPRSTERTPQIHPTAIIHPTAQIGSNVWIGPYVTIDEHTIIGAGCTLHSAVNIGRHCHLKDDVTLHPQVILYDGCILGNRVTIHSHSVIGADGFGYRFQQGRHIKVPQLGYVEIADDVEVGACSTIDRGTFGPTRIGEGTKIDNHVMVAHNCQIGKHNVFASQVGIAGSTTTGDFVVMAGQVGVADHLTIGSGTVLGAKAGVYKDASPNQRLLGVPAIPDREQKRLVLLIEKLPEFRKQLRRVMQHLGLNESDEMTSNAA